MFIEDEIQRFLDSFETFHEMLGDLFTVKTIKSVEEREEQNSLTLDFNITHEGIKSQPNALGSGPDQPGTFRLGGHNLQRCPWKSSETEEQGKLRIFKAWPLATTHKNMTKFQTPIFSVPYSVPIFTSGPPDQSSRSCSFPVSKAETNHDSKTVAILLFNILTGNEENHTWGRKRKKNGKTEHKK